MTEQWSLVITCPSCGGPLEHVASGKPDALGRNISAIVKCVGGCRPSNAEWQLLARMVPVNQMDLHH